MRALVILALALASSGSRPAQAQTLYGSIVGNVTDPANAAVAGAVVTISDTQTNLSRQTAADGSGVYSFPNVVSGVFVLQVKMPGFAAFTANNVQVTINNVTRFDIQLALGSVNDTVEVSANAAVLQTDRAEVRSEIVSSQLTNLPVPPGRNYQQFFKILPGFRPPTNAGSVPANPARSLVFNVNGVSTKINSTRVDGASTTHISLPEYSVYAPTLEAIETINVVTNSFDAEQGLAGGAAINLQIKSGTNQIHGSMFEYYSGNALKAKPFFLPAGQGKPKLVVNELGGSLGGPIKRDKLFYFVSYEANYNRELASQFVTVPTQAIRRGDMSGSVRPIYDARTGNVQGANRTPFPDNIVPASRISSISRKLIDLTPLPNLNGLQNNYFVTGSYQFDRHRVDTKVNWNANQKMTMFGRFSVLKPYMFNQPLFGDLGGPGISTAGSRPGIGDGNTYSMSIGSTYTFTPRLFMDANFGYVMRNANIQQLRLGVCRNENAPLLRINNMQGFDASG